MKNKTDMLKVQILLTVMGIALSSSAVLSARGKGMKKGGQPGRGQFVAGAKGFQKKGMGRKFGGGKVGARKFGGPSLGGRKFRGRGYRFGRRDFGIGIRGRGRRRGVGFVIDAGFWGRPDWAGWRGRYWGKRGRWLGYGDYWRDQYDWPQIYNETGERIKFYVSERYGSRYTLTVVTESGLVETFRGLEVPEMAVVEVFIDADQQLQIAPR